MQNFMKTILSAFQTWTKGKIKESTADWNQNDSSKDSYVKNRTHWEEEVENVLIPETTVLCSIWKTINAGTLLEVGTTYTVNLNGQAYECTAYQIDGNEGFYLGNQYIRDGINDTQEPFIIWCSADASSWELAVLQNGEYTLSINTTVDGVATEILAEQTVIIGNLDAATYKWFGNLYLQVGETYYVKYDGVLYECVAYEYPDWNAICIGNGSMIGASGGSDEPFVFDSYDSPSIYTNYFDAGTHTISISTTKTVIHTLDAKYLPEEYATMSEVDTKMDKINPVGTGSFSMNRKVDTVIGNYSHAEGYVNTASGNMSHAEGNGTTASQQASHAEGDATIASGLVSHAEGGATIASGQYSHTEGLQTQATTDTSATTSGTYSTTAGYVAHAEGYGTVACGAVSHAEGNGTKASGNYSHAEGNSTTASGGGSHAEGSGTTASGGGSHAEGSGTTASGISSHAEGQSTIAQTLCQHVQGKFNILDVDGSITTIGKYVHIVGNGTSASKRSNAHTLDWNGVGWFQGGLQVGGAAQDAEGVGYVPSVPAAQVGQTIIVSEVDANGKPAKWEAVDILYKNKSNDYLILNDANTGAPYKIEIRDGNLVSSLMASLDDFTYTTNDDGTYTITGWNETNLGEPSTEMIVPNDGTVII